VDCELAMGVLLVVSFFFCDAGGKMGVILVLEELLTGSDGGAIGAASRILAFLALFVLDSASATSLLRGPSSATLSCFRFFGFFDLGVSTI